MKDGRGIRPLLVVAFLLIAAAWVWLAPRGVMPAVTEGKAQAKQGAEIQEEKKTGKPSEMQLPVMVKLVSPAPPRVEVETKLPVKETRDVAKPDVNSRAAGGTGAPNLFASYEMPVRDYIAYMRAKGAKVYVYSKSKDRIVGEISEDGGLSEPSGTVGMSRRARRLTDDLPKRNEVLTDAEEKFGPGSFEILLLLPDGLENLMTENVTKTVEGEGLSVGEVETVFMTYRGSDASLSVYVERAVGGFGERRIGKTFSLEGGME